MVYQSWRLGRSDLSPAFLCRAEKYRFSLSQAIFLPYNEYMIEQRDRETFLDWLEASEQTVFFGGAGVSVASGIPDFRSSVGIYADGRSAEEKLHIDFMLGYPDLFWPSYREVFMAKNDGPNPVHYALARMEGEGRLKGVITQNIDGLHQQAGSKHVLELHGSGQHFYCLACGAPFTFSQVETLQTVPRCECGGIIRPDIVFYGEGLNMKVIDESIAWLESSDLIIVAGTSLVVYPAAGLLSAKRNDAKLVIMNKATTCFDRAADLCFAGDLVETFCQLGLCEK